MKEKEVIETVELTITNPVVGTKITCSDESSGLDQKPIPEVIPLSDKYSVGSIDVDGKKRAEVFWKDYATLIYYSDLKIEEGKQYNVFGRIVAAPGYTFYDPINLIVNGVEQPIDATEDYSLESDQFYFYVDVDSVKE